MGEALDIEWRRPGSQPMRCQLPLQGVLSIGSEGHCDVVVDGPEVAAQHVFVMPTPAGIRLFCRAGCTFTVGGISLSETPPTRNARIQIGGWHFELSIVDDEVLEELTLADGALLPDMARSLYGPSALEPSVEPTLSGEALEEPTLADDALLPDMSGRLHGSSAPEPSVEITLADDDAHILHAALRVASGRTDGMAVGGPSTPMHPGGRRRTDAPFMAGPDDGMSGAVGPTDEIPQALVQSAVNRERLQEPTVRDASRLPPVERDDPNVTVESGMGPWKRIPRRPTMSLSEAEEVSLDPTIASQLPPSVAAVIGARSPAVLPSRAARLDPPLGDEVPGIRLVGRIQRPRPDTNRPQPPTAHVAVPAPRAGPTAGGIPAGAAIAAPTRVPDAHPPAERVPVVVGSPAIPARITPPDLPWSLSSPGRARPARLPTGAAPPRPDGATEQSVPSAPGVESPHADAIRRPSLCRMLWNLFGGYTISGRADRLPIALLVSGLAQLGLLVVSALFFEVPELSGDPSQLSERYIDFITVHSTVGQDPPETSSVSEEPIEPVVVPDPGPKKKPPARKIAPEPAEPETPAMEPEKQPKPAAPDRSRSKTSPDRSPQVPRPPTDDDRKARDMVDAMLDSNIIDVLDAPLDLPSIEGGIVPRVPAGASGQFGMQVPATTDRTRIRAENERQRREHSRTLREQRRQRKPVAPRLAFDKARSRLNGGSADEQSAIRSVISAAGPQFRACLERTTIDYPEIQGRIALSFDIAPDGSPRRVKSTITPTPNRFLSTCTQGVVSQLRFERRRDDRLIQVNYPLLIRRLD